MKEPPIAVANRNATTQFATQGQQQAAVMMVYGLDNTTSNTDKLFNLVCLYGEHVIPELHSFAVNSAESVKQFPVLTTFSLKFQET